MIREIGFRSGKKVNENGEVENEGVLSLIPLLKQTEGIAFDKIGNAKGKQPRPKTQ